MVPTLIVLRFLVLYLLPTFLLLSHLTPALPPATCVPAAGTLPPQAVRPARVVMHVCVRGFEHLRLCSDFCLLRPSAPALRCLGAISGTGGLPWCLDFSCVCAERLSVAPAVGTALPYICAWCLGGTGCSVMCVESWFLTDRTDRHRCRSLG